MELRIAVKNLPARGVLNVRRDDCCEAINRVIGTDEASNNRAVQRLSVAARAQRQAVERS